MPLADGAVLLLASALRSGCGGPGRLWARGPARGQWTNLGRLPLGVFSIGKYAFLKKTLSSVTSSESIRRALRLESEAATGTFTNHICARVLRGHHGRSPKVP